MKPFVKYTVIRLALFVACFVVLYLVGMRGWLVVIVTAVIAGLLSYIFLNKQSRELSDYLAQRREAKKSEDPADKRPRLKKSLKDDEKFEDAVVDQHEDNR